MSNIDLKVNPKVTVAINATIKLEDGTAIKATSRKEGIQLAIRKPKNSWWDSITVPEAAFEQLEDLFIAVREAREENAA